MVGFALVVEATVIHLALFRLEKVERGERMAGHVLRRSINFFYNCSAVHSVNTLSSEWVITLHTGNNPRWLEPHLDNLADRIR